MYMYFLSCEHNRHMLVYYLHLYLLGNTIEKYRYTVGNILKLKLEEHIRKKVLELDLHIK